MGKSVRCPECGEIYRTLERIEDLRDNDSICIVCNAPIEVADWDRVLASYEEDDFDDVDDLEDVEGEALDDWDDDDDDIEDGLVDLDVGLDSDDDLDADDDLDTADERL
jgi:hypothetical protein